MSPSGEAAELFEVCYPPLAGWCRKLVDSDELAHEIAAEAFTRLWARWSSVEEPRGFLYVTAANLVRDHWRRTERERRALRRAAVLAPDQAPPADHGHDIRALVQSLPDRLRVPVLLHYYADLSIAEVAVLLHRRQGTIKSDMYKAREVLRASLRGLRDPIA